MRYPFFVQEQRPGALCWDIDTDDVAAEILGAESSAFEVKVRPFKFALRRIRRGHEDPVGGAINLAVAIQGFEQTQ